MHRYLTPFAAAMICSVAFAQHTTPEVAWDVIIEGGTVFDGTGAPGRRLDLAIAGDRIVAIGDLSGRAAKLEIDAAGLVVCPGFIDLHNHGDQPLLRDGTRESLSYLTQGCTTVITGNCGSGHTDVDWYFGKLAADGVGTNVGHLVPQGSVRLEAMGGSFDRAPTEAQLEAMKAKVERAMRAGAFGMSTGLIYAPSSYASTDEIVALADVVARFGGLYVSHIRGEGDHLIEALGEAIEIGRLSGCAVHISHFKASTPPNWGKVKQTVAIVEKARAEGMTVTADQYPYRASSTSLAALVIPSRRRAGTNDDLVARLDDPKLGPIIRREIAENYEDRGGADQILIASYDPKPEWNGKTVLDVARETGMTPVEVTVTIQRGGGAGAVAFSMCEEDVEYVMKQRWVATASDGSSKIPGPTRPHPRSYGTFPRKIGRYAIEKGVVSLAFAIHSSTGLPASILGLEDRGVLRKGAAADVVVFDPKTFRDRATFVEPHRYSTGVRYCFVNGVAAIAEGRPTKALAGRPLRKPARGGEER